MLALCATGCNITSFRWTQPCRALHLRLMLQFGCIINCLSLPCSEGLFDVSYTIDDKFRVIFAFSCFWNLCSLSKFMCMNWLVLLKLENYIESPLYVWSSFIFYFYLLFLTCNFVIAICYCSTMLVKLLVKFCFSNPAATNMYLLFSSGVVNFDEGRRGRQKSLFCCFLFFLAFSQFNFSCKFELIAFHFSISNVSSLLHHYL